ncbi:ADP ribosylation factor, partial [Rozella allomycis CSF55]
TVIKKNRMKEREIRILILGLDNSGKTTILKKLNNEPIDTVSPTLGFNIKTMEHLNYKLNIWDVGGQKSIRAYWRNYFEQTDGLVWVVDSMDERRLLDCKNELSQLLQEERLFGVSLLIMANKQDIPGAMVPDKIQNALDLQSIKTHSWFLTPCSAFTGNNLENGMDWIVKDIASRIFLLTDT